MKQNSGMAIHTLVLIIDRFSHNCNSIHYTVSIAQNSNMSNQKFLKISHSVWEDQQWFRRENQLKNTMHKMKKMKNEPQTRL